MLQNRLKPNSLGEQEGDNGSGFLLRLKIPLSDSDALWAQTHSPPVTQAVCRLILGQVGLGAGWVRVRLG